MWYNFSYLQIERSYIHKYRKAQVNVKDIDFLLSLLKNVKFWQSLEYATC